MSLKPEPPNITDTSQQNFPQFCNVPDGLGTHHGDDKGKRL